MSKAWIGYRVLQLPTGGQTRIATKDSAAACERAMSEAGEKIVALMKADLVFLLPTGEARPTGIKLGQLLDAIGVKGIGHHIEEVEVEGSIEVPRPRLIIPSN